MELDENTGGEITLVEAQNFVKAFTKKYPNEVKAFFMGKVNVNSILNQTDCIGIRIYNGYDVDLSRLNLVLVGVDKDGKDMTDGVIMDQMKTCPSYCDTSSSLMNI